MHRQPLAVSLQLNYPVRPINQYVSRYPEQSIEFFYSCFDNVLADIEFLFGVTLDINLNFVLPYAYVDFLLLWLDVYTSLCPGGNHPFGLLSELETPPLIVVRLHPLA